MTARAEELSVTGALTRYRWIRHCRTNTSCVQTYSDSMLALQALLLVDALLSAAAVQHPLADEPLFTADEVAAVATEWGDMYSEGFASHRKLLHGCHRWRCATVNAPVCQIHASWTRVGETMTGLHC